MRTRAAVVLSAICLGLVIQTPAAAAPRVVCDSFTKKCRVVADNPGSPGGREGDSGGRDDDRDGAPVVDAPPSLGDLCFYEVASPQPPASAPVWAGRDPSEGTIYMRNCPLSRASDPVAVPVFVADGDAPPVSVSPAQLAQRALESLELPEPVVKRSPSERNRDAGVPYTWVGLWTWFWTSPARWRPLTERAAAGPVFAEVTVTPETLIFDPGDGSAPVSCPGPGRPWRSADENSGPSDGGCGYRYRSVTSGGPLTATLSIRWSVAWIGSGGAGGTLPAMTTSTTSTFEVQQLQAVGVVR